MPELAGIHHVKIPVADVPTALAWYERVFGLKVAMEFKDDQGIVRGVVGELPGVPNTLLAFRENPELTKALEGFDPVSFAVRGRAEVAEWVAHLDELGVANSGLKEAAIGWIVFFHDPNGFKVHIYSYDKPET